jgi:hypothetical protein
LGQLGQAVFAFFVGFATLSPIAARDALAAGRGESDARYRARLLSLSQKCDELGLNAQAESTRQWFIERDRDLEYVFLDPESPTAAPASDAPLRVRQWYAKFVELRAAQAAELWRLAEEAAAKQQLARAFRLLHEVLREDPQHQEALRLLALRPGDGVTANAPSEPKVRRASRRHPQFGWAPGRAWLVETDHYRIETNHSARAGIELSQHLERLHAVWRQLFVRFWLDDAEWDRAWQDGFGAGSQPAKHRVVLFRSRREYVNVLQRAEPRIDITLGIYRDAEQTAYFYTGQDGLSATWRHEASHQLFHEIARASSEVGREANFWIVEGIAMYMESLRDYGDYCTLGGIDADRLQFSRYRVYNEGFYVPLDQLVAMSRDELQRHERIRRLYSQSAGLTHFLMHYDGASYQPSLIQYLREVYAGRDRPDALAQFAGVPYSQLDAEYREFLQVGDDDLTGFKYRDGIAKLSLGHTDVTDEGLSRLGDVSRLEWLDLSHCAVTDKGIESLSKAASLRQLSLERTGVTDLVLETIRHLRGLEELDLSYTSVSDAGAAQLAALTKLKVLWLTGTQITDTGLERLVRLTSLEFLDVEETDVSAAALRRLQESLPALENSQSEEP